MFSPATTLGLKRLRKEVVIFDNIDGWGDVRNIAFFFQLYRHI